MLNCSFSPFSCLTQYASTDLHDLDDTYMYENWSTLPMFNFSICFIATKLCYDQVIWCLLTPLRHSQCSHLTWYEFIFVTLILKTFLVFRDTDTVSHDSADVIFLVTICICTWSLSKENKFRCTLLPVGLLEQIKEFQYNTNCKKMYKIKTDEFSIAMSFYINVLAYVSKSQPSHLDLPTCEILLSHLNNNVLMSHSEC